ncbi:MAG: hypothetical protein KGJ34_00100 [Patescibacteria group bacterium]|nr:hypothetical protein [Patescibacteria group bacterium]
MEKTRTELLRILTVVGLVLLLILGAWGIIIVASNIPNVLGEIGGGFSSLFSQPFSPQTSTSTPTQAQVNQVVVVSIASSTLPSGSAFMVSWTHSINSAAPSEGAYGYEISYACTSGLSLDAPIPTGAYQAVPCNTPFNYVDATEHMLLIPHVPGEKNVATEISVSAVNLATGAITATGSASVTIAPTKTTAPVATAPATKGYSVKGVSKGYPAQEVAGVDLSVRILSAGQGSVEFEIGNAGSLTAPAGWIFTASLPLSPAYTYISAPQQALPPGGYIVYTLNWRAPIYSQESNCNPTAPVYPIGYPAPCYGAQGNGGYLSSGVVTITADPGERTGDVNFANNTASATIY